MTSEQPAQKTLPSELNNEQFSALQSMAFTFLQYQQYNKAGALLKVLNQHDPNNQQILFSLAFVLLKVEHVDDAQALIAPHLNQEAETPQVLRLLHAKILMAKGQHQDAATQLEHYTD